MRRENSVLVVPGSFALVSNYDGYPGLDIWLRGYKDGPFEAEWIIAHSAGVHYALSRPLPPGQKLILINPVIERNLLKLAIRDIIYFWKEGTSNVDMVPAVNWLHGALLEIGLLLRVDVLKRLRGLPRENVVVIKGLKDTYFCDAVCAEALRKEGFTVYEVESAHNWDAPMASKVRVIMANK